MKITAPICFDDHGRIEKLLLEALEDQKTAARLAPCLFDTSEKGLLGFRCLTVMAGANSTFAYNLDDPQEDYNVGLGNASDELLTLSSMLLYNARTYAGDVVSALESINVDDYAPFDLFSDGLLTQLRSNLEWLLSGFGYGGMSDNDKSKLALLTEKAQNYANLLGTVAICVSICTGRKKQLLAFDKIYKGPIDQLVKLPSEAIFMHGLQSLKCASLQYLSDVEQGIYLERLFNLLSGGEEMGLTQDVLRLEEDFINAFIEQRKKERYLYLHSSRRRFKYLQEMGGMYFIDSQFCTEVPTDVIGDQLENILINLGTEKNVVIVSQYAYPNGDMVSLKEALDCGQSDSGTLIFCRNSELICFIGEYGSPIYLVAKKKIAIENLRHRK